MSGLKLSANKANIIPQPQNVEFSSIMDFHLNDVRNAFNKKERDLLGSFPDYLQTYSFTPNPDSS
jgi:asparagine synthase (glutamine-hydrolysing)